MATNGPQRRLVLLSCSHVFHQQCVDNFERFRIDDACSCPVCRATDYAKRLLSQVCANPIPNPSLTRPLTTPNTPYDTPETIVVPGLCQPSQSPPPSHLPPLTRPLTRSRTRSIKLQHTLSTTHPINTT